MKSFLKILITSLMFISAAFAQTQYKIMTYNLLNYPGVDTTTRNQYFRTVVSSINPDIIIVQEMTSLAGVNGYLNNVLNVTASGYSAGTFIDGTNDTENAIFFKNTLFSFLSNVPIKTALRDINEFKLIHISTGDTLRIYSLHLKADTSEADRLKRAAEVDSLRKRTNSLPPNSNFMVVGDFNIYNSSELAFQKLLSQSQSGYVIDPLNLIGDWGLSSFAAYHTQSTRDRQFGGGAFGGLDDRFDMILMSQSIINSGDITYIPGSYNEYGNDGNHFNDSINKPPNAVVSQQVADALHYASDHLPVYAAFSFEALYLEITSFTALIEGFYDGSTMKPDTVMVELRNNSAPYSLVDQAKIFLNSSGQGSGKFYNAMNGVPYYIVLKHRNAIETWSASPQVFSVGTLTYDFTTASNKAYGNNLKLIGSKWCIYGGDVNQDGFVETTDVSQVFTGNVNGTTGYISTDLNGDGFTEIEDLNIVFRNNVLGVHNIRP